jgi:helix-turn-helix, Psq domain
MQNGPTLGSFGTKSSRPELKRYRQYTRHDIAAAIDAVRSGMSALQASRLYGVPSRTLYDKVKKLGIVTGRPYRQSIAVAVSLAQGGNLAGVSPRDDDDSMDVKEAPRFHGLGRVNPLEELGLYFTPTDLALGRADESRHLSRPDAIPAPIDLSQSYERMLRADGDNQRSTESEKTEISEKSA